MRELNKDIVTRDKIIFGKYRPNIYEHQNGVINFNDMPLFVLQDLKNKNYIDMSYSPNKSAPTSQDIYNFMKKWPNYTARGFVTSDSRKDYGVYLIGVYKGAKSDSVDEFKEFNSLFENAAYFVPSKMSAWHEAEEEVLKWEKR